MKFYTRDTVRELIGQEVGLSPWVQITQEMIDAFARLTGDFQFIHVDVERARQTPLGGTIAHGLLTLAMLGGFATSMQFAMAGATMGYNYGFDKVRFLSPVRAGRRIRGRFTLRSMHERAPGQWLGAVEVAIEVEGEPKPALIADWLTLTITTPDPGPEAKTP